MHASLNNRTGVSVVLLNKKLTLKVQNTLLNVIKVDTQFKLQYTTKPNNVIQDCILFAPGDLKVSHSSFNSNLVQKNRKSYFNEWAYTKFGATSKLRWFFHKFKYHGKGLKIKKSTKAATVDFNLGSSHISKLYFNTSSVSLLRTKKNSYTAVTHKLTKFFSNSLAKTIRPYNIYTKRGVRVSRQAMCRRFGKVSQLSPKKR